MKNSRIDWVHYGKKEPAQEVSYLPFVFGFSCFLFTPVVVFGSGPGILLYRASDGLDCSDGLFFVVVNDNKNKQELLENHLVPFFLFIQL